MKLIFLFLFLIISSCGVESKNLLTLGSLFQDHMVLQQDTLVSIWGAAYAGDEVKLKTSWGQMITTKADDSGKWHLKVKTPKADHKSHKLTVVSNKNVIEVMDILMGEVWLASGQSNMEMPLKGFPSESPVDGAEEEIPSANFPKIRMFTVGRKIAFSPQQQASGKWKVCSPKTVGDFSAVGYYFARKLHQELGTPVGILHSSWNGSPSETWAKPDYIENLEGTDMYGSPFNKTKKKLAISSDPGSPFNQWINSLEKVAHNKIISADDFNWLNHDREKIKDQNYNNSGWKKMNLNSILKVFGKNYFNGSGWIKQSFEFNGEEDEEHSFVLGKLKVQLFTIFINGEMVLRKETWGKNPESFTIPKNTLKKGQNSIAIRILDWWGVTGVLEDDKRGIYLYENKVVGFSDKWDFKITSFLRGEYFYLLKKGIEEIVFPMGMKETIFSPSTLYNGMITPLIPYTLKGFLWYQGETNRGNAEQYKKLFPAVIDSWRDDWDNQKAPFYYVQLAPVGTGNNPLQDSLHAAFRETQRLALKKQNLGMAITTDVGHRKLVHAPNKKPVGERLALWALAKNYGFVDLVYSGPLYKSVHYDNGKAIVSFNHTGSGLYSPDKSLNYFELAGEDGKYHTANAIIKEGKVIVWSKKIKNPKSVRYGWKSYLEPNFFNQEGLPASSFSSDN